MAAISRRRFQRVLGKILGTDQMSATIHAQIRDTKMLCAALLTNHLLTQGSARTLQDAEFKVYSQFGDDGIIQYLIHRVGVPPTRRTFIEFGVEDYTEANTRFLLMKDNWRGYVMDGSKDNIETIRRDEVFWKHELGAKAAFIDRENINQLLTEAGFGRDIGILSIDIDGNDYWVWNAIHVVEPLIVIVEYNSVFGGEKAVAIPYDRTFQRSLAHSSNLFWGASLRALNSVAKKKGYAFVGCNSAGNNAYFVHRDHTANLNLPDIGSGYVQSRFRESRGDRGGLTFLTGRERIAAIRDCPVFDVEKEELRTIAEVFGVG